MPTASKSSHNMRRSATRLVTTILAMTGWRVDQLNPAWFAWGTVSFMLAQWLVWRNEASWVVAYFTCGLLFRYLGASLLLAWRAIPRALIDSFGETKALQINDTLLGLMFFNHALGLWCMAAVRVDVPYFSFGWTTTLIGMLCMLVGAGSKLWATYLVGLDAYYYHDLFLGRPVGTLVRSGPYRFLANPMYSIGQLHTYGYALFAGSALGLMAAAACHALVYAFYFTVEKPFVVRHILQTPPLALTGQH